MKALLYDSSYTNILALTHKLPTDFIKEHEDFTLYLPTLLLMLKIFKITVFVKSIFSVYLTKATKILFSAESCNILFLFLQFFGHFS